MVLWKILCNLIDAAAIAAVLGVLGPVRQHQEFLCAA
jgi:hypothetical protein